MMTEPTLTMGNYYYYIILQLETCSVIKFIAPGLVEMHVNKIHFHVHFQNHMKFIYGV